MYDNKALNLSKQYIADQINYLYNCYTYIRQIVPIDSDGANMRTVGSYTIVPQRIEDLEE